MNSFLLRAAALLCLLAVRAHTDLAPEQYRGYGVTAVASPDIRMVSAQVDIVWGSPGTLTAVFVLDNEADHAVDVSLGFPVNLPDRLRDKERLNFTMSFDGTPEPPDKITEVGQPKDNVPAETTWYRYAYTFPPGRTTVTVTTKLPPSRDYEYGYAEQLLYCVQTGASWKGNIGTEEVNIHFPREVLPGQVVSAVPAGYTLEGDTVRWRFRDFEPAGSDYDIDLRYLRPDVLPTLARLRAEAARSPGDEVAALALVKCLFAVAPRTKGFGSLSSSIDEGEHQEILAHLHDARDRALFQAAYVKRDDGSYQNKNEGVTDEWEDLEQRLNENGYVPNGQISAQLREAVDLTERLLREHPHNADAWTLYLVNYPSFHYVPRRLFVSSILFPSEERLLKQAYENCQSDLFLRRLWKARNLLTRQDPAFSEAHDQRRMETEAKLYRAFERHQVFENAFEKIE